MTSISNSLFEKGNGFLERCSFWVSSRSVFAFSVKSLSEYQ